MEENRKFYFCDQTAKHPHWEIIQILTDKTDPKCPYCKRIMTYGTYWKGRKLSDVLPHRKTDEEIIKELG